MDNNVRNCLLGHFLTLDSLLSARFRRWFFDSMEINVRERSYRLWRRAKIPMFAGAARVLAKSSEFSSEVQLGTARGKQSPNVATTSLR